MTTNIYPALTQLGFSEIENAIYTFLLSEKPSTGYRISHAIGKPTANTYQAIAVLERKGALLIDEGENRVCRAVPPRELLSRLEREFQASRERAELELSALEKASSDQRIYQLKTVDQVLERSRAMLARARDIVLLDLFPLPAAQLADELAATAMRGVRVVAKIYAAMPIHGVETVLPVAGGAERVRKAWPGEQISLVVDATEHLLALLEPEMLAVRQAVWSNSVFLSCMHHNHLATEVILAHHLNMPGVPTEIRQRSQEKDDISLLRARPRGLSLLQGSLVAEGAK